jgi:hypothetical protein
MTVTSLATGVAAVAMIGAAAAGITAVAVASPAPSIARPVVFGAPLPLDQTGNVPTAGQLTGVLDRLVDPGVPFASKGALVEGGIGPTEAHLADHALHKAAKKGQLPLSFTVSNIQPTNQDSATADVVVSGPKLASPVTEHVTFVNQGSWILSRDSAMSLLHAASAD